LRQGNIEKAKIYVREAIDCVSNVQSARRREQFHKRYLARLEEECVLAGMIDQEANTIDVASLQDAAVKLLPKSEDELAEILGASLPGHSVQLLLDINCLYKAQLPAPDRKLLPAARNAAGARDLGRKVGAAFKRVAWKAVCDPDCDLYKAWSKNLEYVYNGKVLVGALAGAFKSWRITALGFIVAITAYIIKVGAAVFCDAFAPDSLMIHVSERD
jgi:hypothetical protein